MNALQYLLIKLGEEACEIGQVTSKATLFGLFDINPKTRITNEEHLTLEINDVLAVVEMVKDELKAMGHVDALAKVGDREMIEAKKIKLLQWADRSEYRGILEPSADFKCRMHASIDPNRRTR
jgi:hypothetical protein